MEAGDEPYSPDMTVSEALRLGYVERVYAVPDPWGQQSGEQIVDSMKHFQEAFRQVGDAASRAMETVAAAQAATERAQQQTVSRAENKARFNPRRADIRKITPTKGRR